MKKTLVVFAAAAALMTGALPAMAHHSFAAEFDINQPITLTGTVTKVEWVNPHGWLHVDVKTADGKVESWAVEAGSPNALLRRGLRVTDFPIGSEVTIQGYRAKDGSTKANGISVKFTDGRDFFMGSSGSGAPVPPGQK